MLSWNSVRARRAVVLLLAAACVNSDPLGAQPRPQGARAPQGQRIEARDGDVVVVENDAEVSIVRRKPATLRVVIDPSKPSAIVLADYAFGPQASDGLVDQSWRFDLSGGNWPIETRWEGQGAVEEWMSTARPMPGPMGIVLDLPQGRIRFAPPAALPVDPSGLLALLTYTSASTGEGRPQSFDASEQYAITAPVNFRSTGIPAAVLRPPAGPTGGVAMGSSVSAVGPARPAAPVRPGGSIPTPRKIRHVDPVMPEAARAARVLGIVIVELVIDDGGAVQNVRVLRSIPLLDEAAVAAARQWLYEPTLVGGQAVPAIITATVEFKMQ